MYNTNGKRPASQKEVLLFTMMGQAMLSIQVLEECLSASITLKVDVGYPRKISKPEATEKLENRLRKYTLGRAIKEAEKHKLYSEDIHSALDNFLNERNWFIHRIVDDVYTHDKWNALFVRIKYIADEAYRIQRAIEDDLISYAEANGLDMSNVKMLVKINTLTPLP